MTTTVSNKTTRPVSLQGKKGIKRVKLADNRAGLSVTKQGYNCSYLSAKLIKVVQKVTKFACSTK